MKDILSALNKMPETYKTTKEICNPKKVINDTYSKKFADWLGSSKATTEFTIVEKTTLERTKLSKKNKQLKTAMRISIVVLLILIPLIIPTTLIGALIGTVSFVPFVASLGLTPVALAISAFVTLKATQTRISKHIYASENFTNFMKTYGGSYKNDTRIFDAKLHGIFQEWKNTIKSHLGHMKVAQASERLAQAKLEYEAQFNLSGR